MASNVPKEAFVALNAPKEAFVASGEMGGVGARELSLTGSTQRAGPLHPGMVEGASRCTNRSVR